MGSAEDEVWELKVACTIADVRLVESSLAIKGDCNKNEMAMAY
jgi:hypothetical protein